MYVTSREVKNTKYVANFHTKAAADEFETFLKNMIGVDREMVGVLRIRNSVVYTMECFKKGYTLAKQFEDDYIARMSPKPQPIPEPEPEPIPEPVVEIIPEPEPMAVIIEEELNQTEESDVVSESPIVDEIIDENVIETNPEPDNNAEEITNETKAATVGSKLTGFFKGSSRFNTN